MDRPWNIVEQVVEDPTTKMRLEFTSVHSEAVKEGQQAPDHDKVIYLRLWTTDRTRVATYAFTRAGVFIKTAVEHVDPGQGTVEAAMEAGMKAADPGLEAAQQARFADVNYADQFAGDIK